MQNVILFVLFENAMGVVKLSAVFQGILGMKGASEWVVTAKSGSGSSATGAWPVREPLQCLCISAELVLQSNTTIIGVSAVWTWLFTWSGLYLLPDGILSMLLCS